MPWASTGNLEHSRQSARIQTQTWNVLSLMEQQRNGVNVGKAQILLMENVLIFPLQFGCLSRGTQHK